MKVRNLDKMEAVAFNSYMLLFFLCIIVFAGNATISNFRISRPENLTEGIIQNITTEFGYKYKIEILYNADNGPRTIKITLPQSIGHIIMQKTIPEFEKGESFPIYLITSPDTGKTLEVLPLAYKNRKIFRDLFFLIATLVCFIFRSSYLIIILRIKAGKKQASSSQIVSSFCTTVGFACIGIGMIIGFVFQSINPGFLLFTGGFLILILPNIIINKIIPIIKKTEQPKGAPGLLILYIMILLIITGFFIFVDIIVLRIK